MIKLIILIIDDSNYIGVIISTNINYIVIEFFISELYSIFLTNFI